jgi:hypothetical protein
MQALYKEVTTVDERLVHQIRENMELMGTEELLKIWETNDKEEYSEEAFEAIRELLKGRGEPLPQQKQPVSKLSPAHEQRKTRYIITGGVGSIYLICLILFFTGIVKDIPLVGEKQVSEGVRIGIFVMSIAIALFSASVLDMVISSEKIKLWRWRLGLTFGVIGLLASTGSIRKYDGIAEITLGALVSFWCYVIVGVLVGLLVDRWRQRKLQS